MKRKLSLLLALLLVLEAINPSLAGFFTGRSNVYAVEASNLPDNAVFYNGHFYCVYTDPVSWESAKSACSSLGGHLVTITDADENKFITSELCKGILTDRLWIGAYKDKVDEKMAWKWVNDEEWDYNKIYETSILTSDKKKVASLMLSSDFWIALLTDDAGKRGYICEWEKWEKGKKHFTIGKHNNTFEHSIENFTTEDPGWAVLVSKDYQERFGVPYETTWEGRCCGVSATMALVYEDMLSIKNLTDLKGNCYAELKAPIYDASEKFIKNINDYYFAQFHSNVRKVSTVCVSEFEGVSYRIMNLAENYVKAEQILNRIITACEKGKILLLQYTTIDGECSHTILITGYEELDNDTYSIELYDLNTISRGGPYYTYLTVPKRPDKLSDFKFEPVTAKTGEIVFDPYYDAEPTLALLRIYDPVDFHKKVTTAKATQTERITSSIGFRVDTFKNSAYTLVDETGKKLKKIAVDETKTVKSFLDGLDGDIIINDFYIPSDSTETDSANFVYFDMPYSSKYTITDASDVDILFTDDENYKSIKCSNAEEIEIDMDGDVQIKGNDYHFEVASSTNNKSESGVPSVVEVQGDAKTDVTIQKQDAGVQLVSGDEVTNVKSTSYVGTAAKSTEYTGAVQNITVSDQMDSILQSAKEAKKLQASKPKITKLKAGKKKLLLKYKAIGIKGLSYQIAYKTGKGKWKTAKTKKTSYTLKKLKSKKSYALRVRAYVKRNGKTYYSKWSAIKKLKIK